MIHSAWFGEAALPDLLRKCMATWASFEVNLATHHLDWRLVRYVAEAVEALNWAAVADYARLSMLWERGGAWLDADVEIVRPGDLAKMIEASFGTGKMVVGMEDHEWCCNAVIVAPPRHKVIGELLEIYNDMRYADTFDGTTTGATLLSDVVAAHRFDGTVQIARPDVFYPWHWRDKDKHDHWKRGRFTPHTVCAHHWAGSWVKK